MTDRQLLQLARTHLTNPEFDVWFTKHYQGHGRHTGSQLLGITIDAYRHRLRNAEAKLAPHIKETV